jgi:hypothetical protein
MSAINFLDEPKFTPRELAEKMKLHHSRIRKLFADEPGVVRIGSRGGRNKRQYFSILIPESVALRVFARMTVGPGR